MSQFLERRKLSNSISSLGFSRQSNNGNDNNDVELTVLGEMFDMKKIKRVSKEVNLDPSTGTVFSLPRIRNSQNLSTKLSTNKVEESFRIACCNNDINLIQNLLQKLRINTNLIKMCETLENTPLHYSASLGRAKMCRLLLENGAEPNCLNILQQTPLHLALKEEKLECAELLIAYGANPYLYDIKGRLPHHYSVHSSTEIKRILVELELDPKIKNIHLSSLHYMSSVGKLEFMKYLLNRGANPNKVNKSGCTPLHLAMFNGQIESANVLVNNGASTNNLGTINLTPLDFYLSHIFNSLNNLFYTKEYNQRLNISNINTIDELELYHLDELFSKLKQDWRFSSYETVLLLIVRNLEIDTQNPKFDQFPSYVSQSTTKISTNNEVRTAYKQLLNYYNKLKFISTLLGTVFKAERNMIQNIFLPRHMLSQDNNVAKSQERDSIFWFLSQIINIILNFMHQTIKYNFECKEKFSSESQEFGSKEISVEMRNLFFNLTENLIKSGEIKNCRSFICQICSKWFYKNYTMNADIVPFSVENDLENKTPKKSFETVITSLCFQYFEEMFIKLNSMLSQPSSLADLCRIKIKFHIKNFPNDLDKYDSVLPSYIKKFIRYRV